MSAKAHNRQTYTDTNTQTCMHTQTQRLNMHTHTHIIQVLMEFRSQTGAAAGAVEPNIAWVRALKVRRYRVGCILC